jgi:preprotein translocase subunit SecB
MNESHQPGIRFVDVILTQLHFEVKGELPKEIPLGIALNYQHQIDAESKTLLAEMKWDVFGNVPPEKRPSIEFTFTILGVFKGSEGGMALEEFSKGHAPGHLVPYARELISNITNRSALPTLRIGPINALALMSNGQASLVATQRKKETISPPNEDDAH